MKILGIERDNSGCNLYRIYQPLSKLSEHNMAEVRTIPDGKMLGTPRAVTAMLESDIIVFHRPASDEWFKFIKLCQKHGKIVVCDYDDDPFNTSPLNPYYQYIGTQEVEYVWSDGSKEMLWSKNPMEHGGRHLNIEDNIRRRDLFRASFKAADLVTTTTEYLAEKLRTINPNTVVVPNCVDFNAYPKIECVKKEIRIGWQGGYSHYEDLWIIKDALKEILRKYSNVKFIFCGDMRFYGLFKDIPVDRVECHDWGTIEAWPFRLAVMNLDIGLCPLVDNEFNKNKSSIKYMEYSMSKCATIASNMFPYSPVITDGVNGLLVDENGWFDAMENLILNKEKRIEIGNNAYKDVEKNHNADTKAYLWLDAYTKLMNKDVAEELVAAK